MAGLQEDLQFVPPLRDVIQDRIAAIYEKAEQIVDAIEKLTGIRQAQLREAVAAQRGEVERYIAACQELATPASPCDSPNWRRSRTLKPAAKRRRLAEMKNRLGLPVPDGYVLTTEAYRQFCGIPLWKEIRDSVRGLDLNDLDALSAISRKLESLVMACEVPRAVEIAITERAKTLDAHGNWDWRSARAQSGRAAKGRLPASFSAWSMFLPGQLVDAYKRVVAGRFSERALFYRLSAGLLEVDSPMAVLFLPVIPARASGIMYTRDPARCEEQDAMDHSHARLGAGYRQRPHARRPVRGIPRPPAHRPRAGHRAQRRCRLSRRRAAGPRRAGSPEMDADAPSLAPSELETLSSWGVRIEEHFHAAQDIEWVLGEDGRLWIVQARPLVLASPAREKSRVRSEPLFPAAARSIPAGCPEMLT